MIDALKKTMLAGLGAAVITKERVQANFDDWVKQGKVTADEAKAAAEKIAADGKREFEEAAARVGDKIRDLFNDSEATHASRIEALENRVAALERRLAGDSE